MAFDPDFDTVAGTRLYVSEGLPTADTAVAYAAKTWTEVSAITQVADSLGYDSNMSTLANISTSTNLQKKASSTRPSAQWQCAYIEDDEGQELIREFAAPGNRTINAFRVVKANGAIRYFVAQTMGATESGTGIDDPVVMDFTLLRQSDTIKAPAAVTP